MKCIHCGVSYSYYNSPEHAGRQSCRYSKSKYHEFIYDICYYWTWILDMVNCKKITPNTMNN